MRSRRRLPSSKHPAANSADTGPSAGVLSQAGALLSWTSERADMLFVCERMRKAAADKRQPQRAQRATYTEGRGHAFRPRVRTKSVAAKRDPRPRCSRRRSAGGDGGTTLFRSVSSDEDGGDPANIAASGSEQSDRGAIARAAQNQHSCERRKIARRRAEPGSTGVMLLCGGS